MKLTIEIDTLTEAEQILRIFKSIQFESVHLVVEDQAEKTVLNGNLLKKINRPIAKKLDFEASEKSQKLSGG